MPVKELIIDSGGREAYPANLYHWIGIAEGIRGFDAVGQNEVDFFHQQGYLVIHDAFSTSEVQSALDGLLALLAGADPTFDGVMYERVVDGLDLDRMPPEEKQDYVRKFMRFVDHDERLGALASHEKLTSVLTRLMGEPPVLFQDMALLKPPRIGREKPWHQDHAYFNYPLETVIAGVWIALDEATTDNGCMVVVPGSHRRGPVVHFKRRDWQICDTHIDNSDALAVPLKPGGCLIFHSLIHHGTPANNSHRRRRALQYHYHPQSLQPTTQEQRLAIFGSDGKDVTC